MRIVLCNRETVESFAIPEWHIMISISTPGDKASLPQNPRRRDTLALEFYDLSSPLEGYQIFTEDMAQEIWDFVSIWWPGHERLLLIIHCDAGLSRSPAIAAAISKRYTGDDSHYFKRYLPNSLVYRIMMNVIEGKRRNK